MENAYLFAWNHKNYHIDKLKPIINEVKTTGTATDTWGIGSPKKVNIGDRAFITRVGTKDRGIFASGKIIAKDFKFLNWEQKSRPGVVIEFDTFLNPIEEKILEIEYVIANTSEPNDWSPRPSGMSINSLIVDELEDLWEKFCVEQNVYKHAFDIEKPVIEGESYLVNQTVYERNRYARALCLKEHGYSCIVCGFNFKDTYGDIGKDFIHVHHLNQLSDNKGEKSETSPKIDLCPVCPNCHAMLHKRNPPYTIDELKEKIKKVLPRV